MAARNPSQARVKTEFTPKRSTTADRFKERNILVRNPITGKKDIIKEGDLSAGEGKHTLPIPSPPQTAERTTYTLESKAPDTQTIEQVQQRARQKILQSPLAVQALKATEQKKVIPFRADNAIKKYAALAYASSPLGVRQKLKADIATEKIQAEAEAAQAFQREEETFKMFAELDLKRAKTPEEAQRIVDKYNADVQASGEKFSRLSQTQYLRETQRERAGKQFIDTTAMAAGFTVGGAGLVTAIPSAARTIGAIGTAASVAGVALAGATEKKKYEEISKLDKNLAKQEVALDIASASAGLIVGAAAGGYIGQQIIAARTEVKRVGPTKQEINVRRLAQDERASTYRATIDSTTKFNIKHKALIGKDTSELIAQTKRNIGEFKIYQGQGEKQYKVDSGEGYQITIAGEKKPYYGKIYGDQPLSKMKAKAFNVGNIEILSGAKKGYVAKGAVFSETNGGGTSSMLTKSTVRKMAPYLYRGNTKAAEIGTQGQRFRIKSQIREYREVPESGITFFAKGFKGKKAQLFLSRQELIPIERQRTALKTRTGLQPQEAIVAADVGSGVLVGTRYKLGTVQKLGLPLLTRQKSILALGSKSKQLGVAIPQSIIATKEEQRTGIETAQKVISQSRQRTRAEVGTALITPAIVSPGFGSPISEPRRIRTHPPSIMPPPFLEPKGSRRYSRRTSPTTFKRQIRYTPTLGGALGFRGIRPTSKAVTGFETREPYRARRAKRRRGGSASGLLA